MEYHDTYHWPCWECNSEFDICSANHLRQYQPRYIRTLSCLSLAAGTCNKSATLYWFLRGRCGFEPWRRSEKVKLRNVIANLLLKSRRTLVYYIAGLSVCQRFHCNGWKFRYSSLNKKERKNSIIK